MVFFGEEQKNREEYKEIDGEIGKEQKNSELYLLAERAPVYNDMMSEIYKEWDSCGIDMPLELCQMVEKYIKDPNYQFGIHRSWAINGAEYEKDTILKAIMQEGLSNLGDASSGIVYKDPPVSKTISMCHDMFTATITMKGSYKGSTGAILVAVPSEYVDADGRVKEGMEDKVYDHNEVGSSYLKPEFILGFVKNTGEGKMEFKSREDLLKSYEELDKNSTN